MLDMKSSSSYKSPELFIVSSGRSGTTLLVSILNATKQIFIPYESDFIARAFPQYVSKNKFDDSDYSKLVDIFYRSSQPEGWDMDKSFIYDFLCEHRPQNFADVHSAICRAYHNKHETEDLLWGIKAPVLIASVDRIQQVYPASKVVHVVRDGRDVFLSYRKVHEKSAVKFGPKTLLENALYWVDGLRRIEGFKDDDRVYELRYEDLLLKPDDELKKLCNFLGVDYITPIHENFQSFEKNQDLVPDKLMGELHKKVSGGIDPTNSQKYKKQLSVASRCMFEILTYPYLVKYNYDTEFSLLSRLFSPFRFAMYLAARALNNWRYSRRDGKITEG